MQYPNLLSGKNESSMVTLSSAELAQTVVKAKDYLKCCSSNQ